MSLVPGQVGDGETGAGLGQDSDRKWPQGHRQEKLQFLTLLRGRPGGPFVLADQSRGGKARPGGRLWGGRGLGAALAGAQPGLGPQQPQGAAQQQAEVRAACGLCIRSPRSVAVDASASPVAAERSVFVAIQASLSGARGSPPARACGQAGGRPCCPRSRACSSHPQRGAPVAGHRPHAHSWGPARAPAQPSPGTAASPSAAALGCAGIAEEGSGQQQSPARRGRPVHLRGANPVGRR